MLFGLARFFLWVLIFFVGCLFIFGLKKTKKKQTIVVWLLISGLLSPITAFLPVENAVINFSSPEQVFNYMAIGTVIDTVEGNESVFIRYMKNNGDYSQVIVLKNGDKYKIAIPYVSYKITHFIAVETGFTAYTVKSSDDNYMTALSISEKIPTVSDSENSFFSIICTDKIEDLEMKVYLIQGFVDSMDEEYHVLFNGEKFYPLPLMFP